MQDSAEPAGLRAFGYQKKQEGVPFNQSWFKQNSCWVSAHIGNISADRRNGYAEDFT